MRTIITAVFMASSLSGCVLLSSDMWSGAVDAASAGMQTVSPNGAKNAVIYNKDAIHDVCIEWNGSVALADFVPGLQTELLRHGVSSRVYDAGSQMVTCPVTLTYVGYISWDAKIFAKAYTPYLTYAALTLRRDGRVLGSAQYRVGRLGMDKWATINEKLGPLVDALLPGNAVVDDGKAPPPEAAQPAAAASTTPSDPNAGSRLMWSDVKSDAK